MAPEDSASGVRMKQAEERYTTCVAAEAEKDVGNPAGVEDIAVAAHGRCWAAWEAYRDATTATYSGGAQTREEKQLAHDRVDAHLRQFERDARRSVMNGLVERTLKRPK
jgi:hypothetical protein